MNIQLRDLIVSYTNPKILDVGCGSPSSYFDLARKGVDFHYTGVDVKSELEICSSTNNDSLFLKFKNGHIDYTIQQTICIEAFDEKFDFRLGVNIQDYLESETRTFDIVVLSNVLHFIEDKETAKHVVNRLKTIIEPNGLMYISVRTISENENHPYTLEEAQELIGQGEVVWNNFAEQSETIQFILQK